MNDYIERDKAFNDILNLVPKVDDDGYCWVIRGDAAMAIVSIPAADVRPVVRAVWRRYSPFTDTYECSNCGEQVIDKQFRTNFCPNCGAKMEES